MGMESIGILCERVRVEEKNILAVLQNEGLRAVPVPPLDLPVAIGADPLLHTEAQLLASTQCSSIAVLSGQRAVTPCRCYRTGR